MKWRGRRTSANVEDRRGRGATRLGGGLSAGVLILFAASVFFPEAVPFLKMFGVGQPGASSTQSAGPVATDDQTTFASVALADTEEVWGDIFQQGAFSSSQYTPAVLVLYTGRTSSPCGVGSAQSGPFYCPADGKIYIDPSFYEVMARQLKAPGDFAQAYVIAHEVAHHVQNQIGLLPKVNRLRQQAGRVEGNQMTVRLELQADCFSGVWARLAQEKFNSLERGDLDEALNAAYQVGDDVIQRMSGQSVDESAFTHGSAEQRRRWFRTGFDSGRIQSCDTFNQEYDAL
ncbi:MAG: neutral zinc metallopeptidase [Rhodobacteraceae bacterium]|nr:neutral zinc metallopeptidase [Paracoccaceae bacterium]